MVKTVQNEIVYPIGKLYAGMTKASIRADIDAMSFKSEKEREKAYNKQIKLFDYANSLVKDEVDDFISEKEIEVYNKKEKTKKILKTVGLITLGAGIAIVGTVLARNAVIANKLKQQKSVLQIIEEF